MSRLHLDNAEQIALSPDLTWWEQGSCVFVGDVKYKRINAEGITHPDLYQLLAYTTALNVQCGLLIYAHGEGIDATQDVLLARKSLEVVTLDINGTPDEILTGIARIAVRARKQREANTVAHASEHSSRLIPIERNND